MRIRTVKPDFWADEGIAELSHAARLLFIACFNIADDEGLLRWNPAYLRAEAFVYDDLTIDDVRGLMGEIESIDAVFPYRGTNRDALGWIVNFHRHQRVNRPQPTKLSPPSLQNPKVAARYAERDNWTCHLCRGPISQEYFPKPWDPYNPQGRPDLTAINPSLDHVKPRSQGGLDVPSNIALAHVGCNKGRRDKPVEDFTTPESVTRALDVLLTSTDADSVIEVVPFTEQAVNEHDAPTERSLPEVEVEVEVEREVEGKGVKPSVTRFACDDDPEFVEFWGTYPRRVGKQAAYKAFLKARKLATAGRITDGARRLADDPNREDQFTPHPSTWLNEGRWDDDPLPARGMRDTTDQAIANSMARARERAEAEHATQTAPFALLPGGNQ